MEKVLDFLVSIVYTCIGEIVFRLSTAFWGTRCKKEHAMRFKDLVNPDKLQDSTKDLIYPLAIGDYHYQWCAPYIKDRKNTDVDGNTKMLWMTANNIILYHTKKALCPKVDFAHYHRKNGQKNTRSHGFVVVDIDSSGILREYGMGRWVELEAHYKRVFAHLNILVTSSHSGKPKLLIPTKFDLATTQQHLELFIKAIMPEWEHKYIDFGTVAMTQMCVTAELLRDIKEYNETHGEILYLSMANEIGVVPFSKPEKKFDLYDILLPEEEGSPAVRRIKLHILSTGRMIEGAELPQKFIAKCCDCDQTLVSRVIRGWGALEVVDPYFRKGVKAKTYRIKEQKYIDMILAARKGHVNIEGLPPLEPGQSFYSMPAYTRATIFMDLEDAIYVIMTQNNSEMTEEECRDRLRSLRKRSRIRLVA